MADACECAGVSRAKGRAMLREGVCQAFLSDLADQRGLKSRITSDYIRSQYLNLIPKLMGEEETWLVDKEGTNYQGKMLFAKDAVAALKEAQKLIEDHDTDGLEEEQILQLAKRVLYNEALNNGGDALRFLLKTRGEGEFVETNRTEHVGTVGFREISGVDDLSKEDRQALRKMLKERQAKQLEAQEAIDAEIVSAGDERDQPN